MDLLAVGLISYFLLDKKQTGGMDRQNQNRTDTQYIPSEDYEDEDSDDEDSDDEEMINFIEDIFKFKKDIGTYHIDSYIYFYKHNSHLMPHHYPEQYEGGEKETDTTIVMDKLYPVTESLFETDTWGYVWEELNDDLNEGKAGMIGDKNVLKKFVEYVNTWHLSEKEEHVIKKIIEVIQQLQTEHGDIKLDNFVYDSDDVLKAKIYIIDPKTDG